MKKFTKFLFLGIVFGITLSKAEIISWYRIYEMFRFQSFHMYGVIGSAVVLGAILIWMIKRFRIRSFAGNIIHIDPKEGGWIRYIVGGSIFGIGWALTGACPGPMFILLGNEAGVVLLMILSAMGGTYLYGILQKRLPH